MTPTTYTEPPQRSGLLTALVAAAIIALVAANIYLYVQLDKVRTELSQMHERIMTEVSNLRDASTVTTASQSRHLDTLKEELEAARAQARSATSQVKAEATAHADQLKAQIEAEEAKVQQQVSAEIGEVKQSATAANNKIADVSSDVGSVKTDVGSVKTQVASTQTELQKTINDLKSARGDLGVQSGLIATNATELQALKRLGERNYFEFKLKREKQAQRVGDITLRLTKVDPKHNKYTVEVMADDKMTEKKDKNINEPVQFYTSKAHQPYEIVVNQVQKDMIVGYLTTPKDQSTR